LAPDDFEGWSPRIRTPLRVPFSEHLVLTNPPPSAGGGLIGFGLALAERADLRSQPFGRHHARLAEILGAVGQARSDEYDARLVEPEFLDQLLSDPAVDAAWKRRTAERALGSTTHVSVLDGEGGAAALTASNGEGCGHVLSSCGVHVNNFLGEEDINPHGFHGQSPGAEMTTMMAPTVVLRDDEPVLALGSGGSNRLRSAVLQVLLNHLAFDRPLREAIESDRMHVEGDKLWFESTGLDGATVRELEMLWPGASRFDRQSMFFGGVHAAASRPNGLVGAGDPRRDGAVCTPDDV